MRKRKPRSSQMLVKEHAEAYGVAVPREPSAMERYLSPNDIGKILNVTGEAVKQWIYNRRLPAVKLANGYWKVRVADFEAYLLARQDVGRRRILVTGSPAADTSHVLEAIEHCGHQAVLAHNFADAMLKASDHQPALFIIHLHSTETDSWKIAEKVREAKNLRSIPILFVAQAEPTEAEVDRALALAAQGLLKQPLTKNLISQEIKRILERGL